MTIERVRVALGGISGIHVTPYKQDGTIDEALLAVIVTRIASAGIHNIVSAGNTGEFYSLTIDEIFRLQAAAFAAIGDKAVKTAAVGRSLKEAIAIGRQGVEAGADALMVHHPLDPFAAPHSQVDYFLAIADTADVPVVAYLRSDTISLADILRLARHSNVAGIKYATPNLMHLSECIRATQDSETIWICGLAEGWAPAFYAAGARGFTSGLINVDPYRSLQIWQALETGRYSDARALIEPIAPFEAMRAKYNNGANVTVVKEAMMLEGLSAGPVRLPGLPRLSEAERLELSRILSALRPNGSLRRAAE